MKESKTILSVSVYATGIKKRCRKINRHAFDMGDHPLDVDRTILTEKALEVVKNGMKSVTGKVRIGLTKTVIKDEDDYTSRSFSIFSDQEYIDLTSNFAA